jgi:hypothetical protein
VLRIKEDKCASCTTRYEGIRTRLIVQPNRQLGLDSHSFNWSTGRSACNQMRSTPRSNVEESQPSYP